MLAHPKPTRQNTPSTFVKNFLIKNKDAPGILLDLACGFGRHSTLAADYGYKVIAADINIEALNDFCSQSNDISCVALDGQAFLPFETGSIDYVVIVEYEDISILAEVHRVLKSGGQVLFQSVSGKGGNWHVLPTKHELLKFDELFAELYKKLRFVGPSQNVVAFNVIYKKN